MLVELRRFHGQTLRNIQTPASRVYRGFNVEATVSMSDQEIRPRPRAANTRMHLYCAIQANKQFMYEQLKKRSLMSMFVIPANPPPNIILGRDRESLKPRFKLSANLAYLRTGRSVQVRKQ